MHIVQSALRVVCVRVTNRRELNSTLVIRRNCDGVGANDRSCIDADKLSGVRDVAGAQLESVLGLTALSANRVSVKVNPAVNQASRRVIEVHRFSVLERHFNGTIFDHGANRLGPRKVQREWMRRHLGVIYVGDILALLKRVPSTTGLSVRGT